MSAIEAKPDMTLIEITEMLEAERGASRFGKRGNRKANQT